MHFMTMNVPRGPRDPFGWFKCVEKGDRLTYDPSQCISWQHMSLGALGPLGMHLVGSNASRGFIGNLWPLLKHFMTTYVPRGPRTPRDAFVLFECIERGHRLTYDPCWHISWQRMSLGSLGPLGLIAMHVVDSNASRGVIGHLGMHVGYSNVSRWFIS